MSTRSGNPKSQINTAVALGVAAGINIALDQSAQNLIAVSIVYTASATAGSRVPTVRILNAAGNVLWSAVFATAVTTGQVPRLMLGSGTPSTSVTTPLQQTFPIPVEMALEASSSLQILDAANIDVADTVAVNILTCH
jgi:hypothetical protein